VEFFVDHLIDVGGKSYEKAVLLGTSVGQAALMRAKDLPDRPRCLCTSAKPEMYIGRRGSNYYLARMPGSANEHATGCTSHLAVSADTTESTAAQILHALWGRVEASGVLAASKGWASIRDAVIDVATGQQVDLCELAEHLLVPDVFIRPEADLRKEGHDAFYQKQSSDTDRNVRYWTFGILKDLVERPYSYQATIKHMPSTKFWVHKDLFPDFPPLPCAEGQMVVCLFSCRKTRTGVEVDEAASLLLDESLRPSLFPGQYHAPTIDEIEQVRKKMGLPEGMDSQLVLGALVAKFNLESR